MTSLHSRDHDLHKPNGEHYKNPPKNHPDPEAFASRLRKHVIAHEITPEAAPKEPRERKRRRADTIDPWLAEKLDKVQGQLGAKVRELLRQQGVSQESFAAELGLSLSSLVDRLSGRSTFDLAEGLFLEQVFGIPLEELLK